MSNDEEEMGVAIANSNSDLLRKLIDFAGKVRFEEVSVDLLFFAAKTNNAACTEVLLEKGVDVNAQDELGDTALYWATTINSLRAARVLMVAGADPQIANHQGRDAIQQAFHWNRSEMIDLFREFGIKIVTP